MNSFYCVSMNPDKSVSYDIISIDHTHLDPQEEDAEIKLQRNKPTRHKSTGQRQPC